MQRMPFLMALPLVASLLVGPAMAEPARQAAPVPQAPTQRSEFCSALDRLAEQLPKGMDGFPDYQGAKLGEGYKDPQVPGFEFMSRNVEEGITYQADLMAGIFNNESEGLALAGEMRDAVAKCFPDYKVTRTRKNSWLNKVEYELKPPSAQPGTLLENKPAFSVAFTLFKTLTMTVTGRTEEAFQQMLKSQERQVERFKAAGCPMGDNACLLRKSMNR